MKTLKRVSFFILTCFVLVLALAQTGSEPPQIIVSGDQFYCPGNEIRAVSDYLNLSSEQPNIRATFNQAIAILSLRSKT